MADDTHMNNTPCALIAEDEPLLALALHNELVQLWPELRIVASVCDGLQAVQSALTLQPDFLFFDIRMPGLDGLQAAAELADTWPEAQQFPILVFVTAHDEYALKAFEVQAVDYVLKPVRSDRLAQTVTRLQQQWMRRQVQPAADWDLVLKQLRGLLHPPTTAPATQSPLTMLQASHGSQLRMVPVDDVLWFEAEDKYVRVFTYDGGEALLRTPLKEMLQRLDPAEFWQIHRGTVVRASAIEVVTRDAMGKLSLRLKGQAASLGVSRLFAHQFKAM
jgi:DNA-binding LytR/AlgR family response regulator